MTCSKGCSRRGIASSGLTCQNKIMIPAYSPELESAYKFVLFYASDKAQEILVKYGIMSSFGYKSPANNNNTEFVNSMFEILDRDDTVLLIPGTKYPMAYKAQLDYTAHSLFTSAQKGLKISSTTALKRRRIFITTKCRISRIVGRRC